MTSAKEAAEWLDDNKEDLAKWGLTDKETETIIKTKPAFISLGIEPHGDSAEPSILALAKNAGELEKTAISEGWKNQLIKANMYKMIKGEAKLIEKLGILGDSADLAGVFNLNTGNIEKVKQYLKENSPLIKGETGEQKLSRLVNDQGKDLRWAKINQMLLAPLKAQGSSGFTGINPSGLRKPSTVGEYGNVFGQLFKDAKLNPGPFKDPKTWTKYSWEQKLPNVERIVREAKPRVFYFGGKDNEGNFSGIAKHFGGDVKTLEVSGLSTMGKTSTKTLKFFVVKHSDGSKTAMVLGPHTSPMGMQKNAGLVENIGKRLAEI